MKKTVTSAGLIALSAAGLHAAYAPALGSGNESRSWSVSASVRGFYDDNYTTRPNGSRVGSWGEEVTPTVVFDKKADTTRYWLGYRYDLTHYQNGNTYDQTHDIDGGLTYSFNKTDNVGVHDEFIIAQQPQVLDPTGAIGTPLRVKGNNIHNLGQVSGEKQVTELLRLSLAYDNNYYNYKDPAYSPILNRDEHLAQLNSYWKMNDDTDIILGYNYGIVDYSSNALPGKTRNNRHHDFYVGVDHRFTGELRADVRVGAQYMDYYNLKTTKTSPYADASINWTYAKDCEATLGVKYKHEPTDVLALDSETATVYGQVFHKFESISPNLHGKLLGQYQHSKFNGGGAGINSTVDSLAMISGQMGYDFSEHITAEGGYDFTSLTSDQAARGYHRNRVFVGLKLKY